MVIGFLIAIRFILAGALVAALSALSARVSLAQAGSADSVWVNTRSGVYHCPGSPVYRNTRTGALMPEREARAKGHRPAGGGACVPANAGVDSTAASKGGETVASDSLSVVPMWRSSGRRAVTTNCQLTRITDGDGIECVPMARIRLIGIDAPEMNQAPFGAAAKAGLASFLRIGSTIGIELDRDPRDRNGRILGYVWVGDVLVNWQMARMGWALAVRYPPNLKYAGELEAAESAARAEGRGLWAIDGFACRPRDRRDGKC